LRRTGPIGDLIRPVRSAKPRELVTPSSGIRESKLYASIVNDYVPFKN